MRIVVMGANGRVGRQVVLAAARAGHEVLATARDVPTHLPAEVRTLEVDVRLPDAVAGALRGADAVAWCVGVTSRSGPGVAQEGIRHLVTAAAAHGLRRVVSVSGAGADLPGDRKGMTARLVSSLTHRLAGDLVTDKEQEFAVLAASDLVFTQVRPPRLVDTDATGAWHLSERAPEVWARPIARADVAAAVLHLLEHDTWVRRAPYITTDAPDSTSSARGRG